MKTNLFRTSSILAVLVLLVAVSLSSTAQEPRTRPQEPAQQEELQIKELAVQQVDAETLRIAVPPGCKGIVPVVQIHGNELDNFNTPDPGTLSPALTGYLTGLGITPKGYDEATINKVFADSFKLKGCRVCYATLEVRVRHQPGQWSLNAPNYSNDTILAGAAPFTPALPDLRFIGPAGIWTATNPNPKVVTFGIAPIDITSLNTYLGTGPMPPFLDVIAQDDTDFDYAKLSVWYYY